MFLLRMSARSIFQLFSACISAMCCCDAACCAAVADWRNCQIDVAASPATPSTVLDRSVAYFCKNRPSFELVSSGFTSSATRGVYNSLDLAVPEPAPAIAIVINPQTIAAACLGEMILAMQLVLPPATRHDVRPEDANHRAVL